jgi:hypothetical protein
MLINDIVEAADSANWEQIAQNHFYGPPCFHIIPGDNVKFCFRAKTWVGHNDHHNFVSLATLLLSVHLLSLGDI